jgi:hypothetical protein
MAALASATRGRAKVSGVSHAAGRRRRRQAAARSAPHFRQRQRVPDSTSARLSGVSSWPLPQRPGGKTVPRTRLGAKSGNIEQVHSTPALARWQTGLRLRAALDPKRKYECLQSSHRKP